MIFRYHIPEAVYRLVQRHDEQIHLERRIDKRSMVMIGEWLRKVEGIQRGCDQWQGPTNIPPRAKAASFSARGMMTDWKVAWSFERAAMRSKSERDWWMVSLTIDSISEAEWFHLGGGWGGWGIDMLREEEWKFCCCWWWWWVWGQLGWEAKDGWRSSKGLVWELVLVMRWEWCWWWERVEIKRDWEVRVMRDDGRL